MSEPGASAFQLVARAPILLRPGHPRAGLCVGVSGRRLRGATGLSMAGGEGAEEKDAEDKAAAAKAAAQLAESGIVGGIGSGGLMERMQQKKALDDPKTQASQSDEDAPKDDSTSDSVRQRKRMEIFEAQLKGVAQTAPTEQSKAELDVRGVRINAADTDSKAKLDEMDSKLRKALSSGKFDAKKKNEDKLRTETGEELFMTEMAPGASISSFALPDGFDPLNPPLPSEMKARKEAAQRESEEAESMSQNPMQPTMPLPSELSSPTKQKLYDMAKQGVEDDSLFTIKSVFEQEGRVAIPGKVVSREERKAREKGEVPLSKADVEDLESLIARDRALLQDKDKPSVTPAGDKKESLGEVVNRIMGLIVVADFFVVIGFLAWLVVSIIWQYAFLGGLDSGEDNPIYNAWYSLWTPVIQPALGILMASVLLERAVKSILPGDTKK